MATASESAAKLAELKKEVVEVLSSCEGHSLSLGQFKPEYKKKFGKSFDKHYKLIKRGKKFKNLMAELTDVISVEKANHPELNDFVIKLKEPADSSHATKKNMTSADKMDSSPEDEFQQVRLDSKLPPKSPVSPTTDNKSPIAAGTDISSTNSKDASSNINGRTFLKAHRRVKKSNEVKQTSDEPTEENTSTLVGAEVPSSPSSTMLKGAISLPLSPPPVPRLEASGTCILLIYC